MTVSANLPLAAYAAGLDDMIAKIVEMKRECRDDPVLRAATDEQRTRASVDAMQPCHFTTTELQILLALALDRLA